MYFKIFEGSTAEEVETKVNDFLNSDEINEFDLYNLVQSESMIVVDNKIERKITISLVFTHAVFLDSDADEED